MWSRLRSSMGSAASPARAGAGAAAAVTMAAATTAARQPPRFASSPAVSRSPSRSPSRSAAAFWSPLRPARPGRCPRWQAAPGPLSRAPRAARSRRRIRPSQTRGLTEQPPASRSPRPKHASARRRCRCCRRSRRSGRSRRSRCPAKGDTEAPLPLARAFGRPPVPLRLQSPGQEAAAQSCRPPPRPWQTCPGPASPPHPAHSTCVECRDETAAPDADGVRAHVKNLLLSCPDKRSPNPWTHLRRLSPVCQHSIPHI